MNFRFLFFFGSFLILGLPQCASTPRTQVSIETPDSGGDKADTNGVGSQNLREQGYVDYLKGDFTKAIQKLEASLLLGEGPLHWPKNILFYCYLAIGDYKSSLRVAESIAREKPYTPLSYQQVGLAHLWLGNTPVALQNFNRALEFENHYPEVHFYAGIAHELMKREPLREKAFREAENEYREVLDSNPKDFNANFELATTYLYWNKSINKVAGLLVAARESVDNSGIEDLPQDRKLYSGFYLPMLEGILYYRQGEAQLALDTLLKTLNFAPSGIKADLSEIYYFIGQSYFHLSKFAESKSFLEKALEHDPTGIYAKEIKKVIRQVSSQKNISP